MLSNNTWYHLLEVKNERMDVVMRSYEDFRALDQALARRNFNRTMQLPRPGNGVQSWLNKEKYLEEQRENMQSYLDHVAATSALVPQDEIEGVLLRFRSPRYLDLGVFEPLTMRQYPSSEDLDHLHM